MIIIIFIACCVLIFNLLLSQVVGSQARILYTDAKGRASIALAFNKAVADGRIKVVKS